MKIETLIQNKPTFTRKVVSRILVGAVLCVLVNVVTHAQAPPPSTNPLLSGPTQIISDTEFNQMVQSGQLKMVSSAVLKDQDQQRMTADSKNQAVVNAFMNANPKLTDVAQLVAATPTDL